MFIKFLLLGGGGILGFGGGGCRFYFYGREDFSEFRIGARAMTTKFLDYKIFTFKILLS